MNIYNYTLLYMFSHIDPLPMIVLVAKAFPPSLRVDCVSPLQVNQAHHFRLQRSDAIIFPFLTTIIALDVQAPLPSQHADLFSLTEYLLEKKSLGAIRHVLAITILRSGQDNDYQSDDNAS